jgi:hypothetical protein
MTNVDVVLAVIVLAFGTVTNNQSSIVLLCLEFLCGLGFGSHLSARLFTKNWLEARQVSGLILSVLWSLAVQYNSDLHIVESGVFVLLSIGGRVEGLLNRHWAKASLTQRLGGSFALTVLAVPASFNVLFCRLLRGGTGTSGYVIVPVQNMSLFDLATVVKMQPLSEFLVPGFVEFVQDLFRTLEIGSAQSLLQLLFF